MECELLTYMMNALMLFSREIKGKKRIMCDVVEFVDVDGDVLRFRDISENNYRDDDDTITSDKIRITFNRNIGVSVDTDKTFTLFEHNELSKIYLTFGNKTLGFFPYVTNKGVVWDLIE